MNTDVINKSLSHEVVMFLDFDGVLHPKMRGTFEYLPNLIRVLELFPTVKIVVSSDWRHGLNDEFYITTFGDYANRIIGITPKLDNSNRENEILQYVKRNGIRRFMAIDDDCRGTLFTSDCSWLFKTNYFLGLNDEVTQQLINYIVSIFRV